MEVKWILQWNWKKALWHRVIEISLLKIKRFQWENCIPCQRKNLIISEISNHVEVKYEDEWEFFTILRKFFILINWLISRPIIYIVLCIGDLLRSMVCILNLDKFAFEIHLIVPAQISLCKKKKARTKKITFLICI